MKNAEYILKPIGVIKTPFTSKYGAPRQPASARERTTGVITLHEKMNFEQALEDLDGFEFIWVLFQFHENRNWKPKVLPPYGGTTKRGVFATRSPHRPNPIGLSLCRLLEVKGRTVVVENPDMLDGTPILDIKPYIPHAEAFPKARAGWIDELNESSTPAYSVRVAPTVRQALAAEGGTDAEEMLTYVRGILSHNPFPHPYRRIKVCEDGTSVLAVKRWRFVFTINGKAVHVKGIQYNAEPEGKK